MKNYFSFAIIAIASLATNISTAAPILQINHADKLTGATGIKIGQLTYNVVFQDGSCVSAYSGCNAASDFLFQNKSSADAATAALSTQVFINALAKTNTISGTQFQYSDGTDHSIFTVTNANAYQFDSKPAQTLGCTSSSSCNINTLYVSGSNTISNGNVKTTITSIDRSDFTNAANNFADNSYSANIGTITTRTNTNTNLSTVNVTSALKNYGTNNISTSTLAVWSVVPEPSSYALMFLGLVGLTIIYRRRQA